MCFEALHAAVARRVEKQRRVPCGQELDASRRGVQGACHERHEPTRREVGTQQTVHAVTMAARSES